MAKKVENICFGEFFVVVNQIKQPPFVFGNSHDFCLYLEIGEKVQIVFNWPFDERVLSKQLAINNQQIMTME